jgi:serine/threonine protein phosphatase PrpC
MMAAIQSAGAVETAVPGALVPETDFAGRQMLGGRSEQQDAYGIVPPEELGGGRNLLAVVADGMGGHAAGALASALALQSFVDGFFEESASLDDPSRLWAGLEAANRRIKAAVAEQPEHDGMGTTLVALLIREGGARWISVGDSPLYLLRDGVLRRLNTLHVQEAGTPGRNPELISALIGERIYEVDDGGELALQAGDALILASDGLNCLPPEEIAGVMSKASGADAAEAAEALMRAVKALERPGQDNTTAAVIRWS